MQAGSRAEGPVWNEFANNRLRLDRTAKAIRAFLQESSSTANPENVFDEDLDAPEGRVLAIQHLRRERRPGLVAKKKANVMAAAGALRCEVCGFDFARRYGAVGHGFIECHHTRPLSEMRPGDKTSLKDLALVCANCHRMLHKSRTTVDQLRAVLEQDVPGIAQTT